MAGASADRSDSVTMQWSDAVRFIRQLSHDLRNYLNAVELQSTYIAELTPDAALKDEIRRLREMISRLTSVLQKLSRDLGQVDANLIAYTATDFVEDLRKRIDREFPEKRDQIAWNLERGNATLSIDPELLQEAFVELFENAFEHDRGKGPLVLATKSDKACFVFTLQEPKTRFDVPTENWGCKPLQNVTAGHYGLGLHRVRVIVEGNRGEMYARYDPKLSSLVTTIVLPIFQSSSSGA